MFETILEDIISDDDAYKDLFHQLSVITNDWTDDNGTYRCAEMREADLAKSILSDYYNVVVIKPLNFEDGEDGELDNNLNMKYHVLYSEPKGEEFDPDGLNWEENKNPDGTPLGIGNDGMAEDLNEDKDENIDTIKCPDCDGEAIYIEGQGNFKLYKCPDCEQYLFVNAKGEVKHEDEVFDEEGNLLSESLTEGSFEDAQDYYGSLKTEEQEIELEEIKYDFKVLGFDQVEVTQLIPTPNSNSNIYFTLKVIGQGERIEKYTELAKYELENVGAKDIRINQAINYNDNAYIHGSCFIEGMTLEEDLHEDIEKHDELNPAIWQENGELKSEVKNKLLEIVSKFCDNLKEDGVKIEPKDIRIIGSNASFNYTKDSDIDCHIYADLSVYKDQEDLAMKVYNAYKSLWNNKYDPRINGFDVELYVEPYVGEETDEFPADNIDESLLTEAAVSKGVYSLFDGWLTKPEASDLGDYDKEEFNKQFKEWEDKYNNLPDEIDAINNLIDDLYILRQDSLLKDGEFGIGNLIFKEFRNKGYLQDLKDKKVELENKEMSLGESKLTEASEGDRRAAALAYKLNYPVSEIQDIGDQQYDTPDGTYMVLTDEEANKMAKDLIMYDIDDQGLNAFSKEFQKEIIDNGYFNSYAAKEFIQDELDYYSDEEQDPDMVTYLESIIDKPNACIEYIKDTLGPEDFEEWVAENIDEDTVADEAINLDGRGHFIAYDGEEIELEDNFYAYRMN